MTLRPGYHYRVFASLALLVPMALLAPQSGYSGSLSSSRSSKHHAKRRHVATAGTGAVLTARYTRTSVPSSNAGASITRRHLHGRRIFFNPWTEPTYADSTVGDNIDGEDLVVRKAAVDAIGPYNGTVVVADPQTGRILSIVNQKLGLKGAYQPCSTVKIVVSLASLKEQIVDPSSAVRIGRRSSIDMTRALAISNNLYFARLGQELGFERVEKYAKLFGLGEKAGLDIPGEEPGYLASEAPETGVGMMTSFGDGIRLTALELTSIVSSVANGGTMYYLQCPKTQQEIENFVPRIKRELEISELVPQVKTGMMGAVEYGTARRASYSNYDETIVGKTGTCTDMVQPGIHLGWFGSFNDLGSKKLVVVVLLTGGRGVSGPIASGVAGNVYRNLSAQNYFGSGQPAALVSLQSSFGH